MFNSRPNDYTFEIVAGLIIFLALIGLGSICWLLISWIF